MKKKVLGIFFTKDVSLELWDKLGILDRELKLLKELTGKTAVRKTVLFTYGGRDDLKYREILPSNMELVINKLSLPGFCYAFLIPFLNFKKINQLDIVRTIQFRGIVPAAICKILLNKNFILRCGFPRARGLKRTGRYFRYVLYKIAESIGFRLADVVVLTDKWAKKCIQENYGIKDDKIFIVPNYIDTRLFAPSGKVKKVKDEVCFVGRLSPVKNLYSLIEAVDAFNGKLKIIGRGELERDLKDFAREKKANVDFLGKIDNSKLPGELKKSEYFVLPSFSEGQPKALLEAMACGLAAVGTDVPGIRTMIEDGVNGILCRTDSEAIARALRNLKDKPDLKEKLKANAREYVKDKYALKRVVQLENNDRLLG